MTLYLKCGAISVNTGSIGNRLTCTCLDAAFCPKTKDKLTMALGCFIEKEPHATIPPFLKVEK